MRLGWPPEARVDTRVPKKLLIEQGPPTAADKRAIRDGVEDIHWVGALKPNTVGVKVFADATREYLEIAVITVGLRSTAKTTRLIELIHRAIPYPVLLVIEGAEGAIVSIAHKRHAQKDTGKVVVEDIVSTAPIKHLDGAIERAFLESLAVSKRPPSDLFTLFEGWRVCIEALNAAQIIGEFALADDPNLVARRREALEEYARLSKEEAHLQTQAAGAKQINRRVELNQKIKAINGELARYKTLIFGSGA